MVLAQIQIFLMQYLAYWAYFLLRPQLWCLSQNLEENTDNLSEVEKLTEKLKNGSLTRPEAEELKIILERDGPTLGNVIGGIAIAALIALVIAYLKDKYK